MESNAATPDNVLAHPIFSDPECRQLIQGSMKSTYSSRDAHNDIHHPVLSQNPPLPLATVLIGDSMIERFKTTGSNTRVAHLPSLFNAGVSGERIENVLYRLDLGLFSSLKNRGIKVWVLTIGTNHIGKGKALKKKDLDAYQVLIQGLLQIAPESRIIACQIFPRTDVEVGNMEKVNTMLRSLVGEMNHQRKSEKVLWLAAPEEMKKEQHLADHVHLNEEGYRIWDEALYPKIMDLLK